MKSFTEYEKTSRPGRPFSSSTEWEMFQFNACLGQGDPARRCVNDDDNVGGCPLIVLMLNDKAPAEWGSGRPRHCTEKTTEVEARRAAKREQEAAEKARLEASHYPMFPEVS
jgi:hypothetical protein